MNHPPPPALLPRPQRVTACKEHIAELNLLTTWGYLTIPIPRPMVTQVQVQCKVPVADAAAAVATHGDSLQSACDQVRATLNLPPPMEEMAAERPPPSPTSDVMLRKLQMMLKRGSCPPSLKSLQVAVHLCHDATPDDEERTFAAHGVDKKEARPRILAYRDRIIEMKLLEELEATPTQEETNEAAAAAAAAGASSSSPAADASNGHSVVASPARRWLTGGTTQPTTPDSRGSAKGGGLPADAAAAAAAQPKPRRTLPLDDKDYLTKLQQRIGVRPPMAHGGKVALPSLECVAAAAEMRLACVQGNQNDVDAEEMCEKHGIPLGGTYTDRYGREVPRSNQGVYNFLRDLIAQLTKLALLDVPPSALDIVPPEYDPALLTSLQMRLQVSSPFDGLPRPSVTFH